MSDVRFEQRLQARLGRDAAALEAVARGQSRGAAAARQAGERRRRRSRSALAVATVLAVGAVAVTAWRLEQRRDAVVSVDEKDPQTETSSSTTPGLVDGEPENDSTTVAPPPVAPTEPTAPPATVLPDPSGAGAVPLTWREVPGHLAGIGTLVTTDAGLTFSLYDAAAATPFTVGTSSTKVAARPTLARTFDGESWDVVRDAEWVTSLAVDGDRVVLAGRTVVGGSVRLHIETSDDAGDSWSVHEVDLGARYATPPVANPLPFSPSDPNWTDAMPEGAWGLSGPSLGSPTLVRGADGMLAVVASMDGPEASLPRCEGSPTASSTYWYVYDDGVTLAVRPTATIATTTFFESTLVKATDQRPEGVVRCTIPLASTEAGSPQIRTELFAAQDDGSWRQLRSDLPAAESAWIIGHGQGGYAAGLVQPDRSVRSLYSTDAQTWRENPPSGLFAGGVPGAVTYGSLAIAADVERHQLVTSTDAGATWQRVDVADLPIPNGPARAKSFQMGEVRAGPLGFVARFIVADGATFWRIFATSADGRTWATADESAIGVWNGSLGPRLGVLADRYVMTVNDSAPTGDWSTDGMRVGYTTRTFIGTP